MNKAEKKWLFQCSRGSWYVSLAISENIRALCFSEKFTKLLLLIKLRLRKKVGKSWAKKMDTECSNETTKINR